MPGFSHSVSGRSGRVSVRSPPPAAAEPAKTLTPSPQPLTRPMVPQLPLERTAQPSPTPSNGSASRPSRTVLDQVAQTLASLNGDVSPRSPRGAPPAPQARPVVPTLPLDETRIDAPRRGAPPPPAPPQQLMQPSQILSPRSERTAL